MKIQQLRILAGNVTQYSDASSSRWAYKSSQGFSADGPFPDYLQNECIAVKEAYALFKGVVRVRKPCELMLFVDNTAVHHGIQKTRSNNRQINIYIMLEMKK